MDVKIGGHMIYKDREWSEKLALKLAYIGHEYDEDRNVWFDIQKMACYLRKTVVPIDHKYHIGGEDCPLCKYILIK